MKLQDVAYGACYSFTIESTEQQYGFVVTKIVGVGDKASLTCALVAFSGNVYNLEDFQQEGKIFVTNMYTPKGTIAGTFCFHFTHRNLELLQKFKWIGNLPLKANFVVGGGTDAQSEPFFSGLLTKPEFLLTGFHPESIKILIADER
jgi:hypothetical protein